MRKILFLLFLSVFADVNSQVLNNIAFDTNGPMGECLFNQDKNGNIVYQDIISCSYSADTIMGLAKEWLYDARKKYKLETKDLMEGITKVECKITMSVGVDTVALSKFNGLVFGSLPDIARDASKVSFNCSIEVRDHKYKYTLSDFYTERRTIHGEGKSEGPSNMIHWQRVNSLTKEKAKSRKKKEYDKQLALETTYYHDEYNAVMDFIKGIRTFAQISKDF
jgi:hypothetical protein